MNLPYKIPLYSEFHIQNQFAMRFDTSIFACYESKGYENDKI